MSSISLQSDAPPSSWGLIIGKGGQTLKKLQEDFNVRIRIPRPNEQGTLTVKGSGEDCKACEAAILKIVKINSRGKQQTTRASSGTFQCELCKSEITGIVAAFQHLGSVKHLKAFRATMPGMKLDGEGPLAPPEAGVLRQGQISTRCKSLGDILQLSAMPEDKTDFVWISDEHLTSRLHE